MKLGMVCWRRWIVCLGFGVSLAASGCGGDDDGDSGPEPGANVPMGTLEEECEASCNKQDALGCTNPIPNCTPTCIDFGGTFPECEPEFIAINHCMAHATLVCDAGGNPAVGRECFGRVNALEACIGD